MTTVGDIVEQIHTRLTASSRDEIVLLSGTITDVATSLTVSEALSGIRQGSRLSLDYEVVLVTAFNTGTLVATVIRGQNGTTAAAHTNGVPIYVNARYPRGEILSLVKEEIKSWGSKLYRLAYTEFPFSCHSMPAQVAVSVDGRFVSVASRVEKYDPHLGWVKAWATVTNALPTTAEGNIRVSIHDGRPNVSRYRLKYGVRFDIYDEDGDDITQLTEFEDMGTPEEYGDIMIFGTMWRALMGKESVRLDLKAAKQGRSRADVREQASSQTSAYWKSLRDERIREEAGNLAVANA